MRFTVNLIKMLGGIPFKCLALNLKSIKPVELKINTLFRVSLL